MEKTPSVLSDYLVAGFMLVVVPLWMFTFGLLIWREKKPKTQFLVIARYSRIFLIAFLLSVLPLDLEGHPISSVITCLLVIFVIYFGLYKYESRDWTKDEKSTFVRNQLMQAGSTLIFCALGILLILFRFPDEKW